MGSSDSDDHVPTKKRARVAGSPEEGTGPGRKARGRPRVDTQDETAADRRRTQIRLAQRAYRQRKETTISALKGRVTALESAIDDMNKAFLQFNDSAMNSGILNMRPELARELKKTTEIFVRLAKEAANDGSPDGSEHEGDEEILSERSLVRRDAHSKPTKRENFPQIKPLDIGWGYAQMFETEDTQPRTGQEIQMTSYLSNLTALNNHGHGHSSVLPFGLIDPEDTSRSNSPFQQFNVRVPSTPLGIDLLADQLPKLATVRSPYTYSFQESTFARRLQRASIERGFHLLSTSSQRPSIYKHVFRLALLSHSREQLIERFRLLLTKTNLETLDFWRTPYIHLGGAGTHYPQRDASGNIIPVPNGWSVQGIGPFPPRVRLYSNNGATCEVEVDLRGFEGEWFDPHDVQGYLEEKGLKISPHSSFAEAWIDMPQLTGAESTNSPLAMDLAMNTTDDVSRSTFLQSFPWVQDATPVDSSTSSSRSPSGSESAETANSTPPTPNLNEFNLDVSNMPGIADPELFSAFEMPKPSTTPADLFGADSAIPIPPLNDKSNSTQLPAPGLYDNFNFDSGGTFNGISNDFEMFDMPSSKTEAAKPQPKKQFVTLDVNKLIDDLINRGVCLGRTPGFRRADVERAFTSSIINAF